MGREHDLGWAAGLLEASGAFYVTLSRAGAPRARIQCRMSDRDVLDRLAAVLGAGRVNGPYGPSGGSFGRKLSWVFQINRQPDVARIALQIKPHMGRRRQQQIAEMLGSISPAPPGPKARTFHAKHAPPRSLGDA